ncbi:tripartite tricarboxylate transporter TctB family protein [Rhodoferax sp.]|uniref:tripartite tricarboxylate transporter TctB family protein n=1 Tax=Rhodoferax sp. TaxID=50421 RepID=UPI0025FFBDC3|nr:tripartite tricarboxylate transporter TctB family protein [Rhodoferax sp.]MCM2339619.1 tripartite tricarboxylate transporter TctB family protein [Rhodoferax sp.]
MTTSQASTPTELKSAGWNMDIVIAGIVSMLAVAAIFFSRKFPTTGLATDIGSARFPQIYAVALLVLCAMLIGRHLIKGRPTPSAVPEGMVINVEVRNYRKTFVGIVSSVICLAAMPYLGYGLVTVTYLSFLMWLMGMRHKAWNPLLALTITAVLYFTFSTGLNVPLPFGSLFE